MFLPSKMRLRLFSLLILALISLLTFYWIVSSSVVLNSLPQDSLQGPQRQQEEVEEFHKEARPFSKAPLRQNQFQRSLPPLEPSSENPRETTLSSPGPKPEIQSPKSDLELAEKEIKERVEKVAELCQKFHLGRFQYPNGSNDLGLKEPPTPLFSFYFWNRHRNLAWCPVYKAGSTSWLHNMMILAGYSEDELLHPPKQLSSLARDAYPSVDIGNGTLEDSLKMMESSLKLLVVRHPFERIVSAYKDKLSNASVGHEDGSLYYYNKYGAKIVKKFRKKPLPQKEPTWVEFVRYLVSTDLLQYSDDHWLPAYYSCTPCLVPFDVIAKTETFLRDQEFLIGKMGLQDVLHPQWSHSSSTSLHERSSLSVDYFSQLPKSLIKQLYSKYSLDFDLFGYDYKAYLDLGRDSE